MRNVLPQRRHAEIVRCLTREGPVSVTALAERLATSQATIRRDLIVLERDGVLTRVRGGAMLESASEVPFERVAAEELAGKDTIASAAAALVNPGDSLVLDIGTTVYRLASQLHGSEVTVLTSNLAVYDELVDDPVVELVLLGGVVRRNYRSMVGFLTEAALRQLRADRLFLSTCGVRADGSVLDDTMVEVPLKRAMLAAADQVVLLADSGKFPGIGLARVCGPEEIDVLITNEDACPRTLAAMREAGVEVITV
ncbi:DeoR/GlpR family DNA-binding transcription regulator [Tamaricihabitans halophyticus]|uniref:DeoR/GlpR family DNA-binding transcription regulator n=1 Tax=Tamaricihabitans halophyticus TaxID=1262583 RepID=UPI001FB4DEAA|nr:DeoR/GlpR family DNA-binding transcription regulator [Tamaricihabitans halophyticus]